MACGANLPAAARRAGVPVHRVQIRHASPQVRVIRPGGVFLSLCAVSRGDVSAAARLLPIPKLLGLLQPQPLQRPDAAMNFWRRLGFRVASRDGAGAPGECMRPHYDRLMKSLLLPPHLRGSPEAKVRLAEE